MSIVLQGSTSGSITLQEPAIAGSTVLSLPATSGTLITTGSSGQVIPKAALPTGSVLQVVQGQSTNFATTTSTSFQDTTLSASITPTSTSSRILVLTSQNGGTQSDNILYVNLVRNSTQVFFQEAYVLTQFTGVMVCVGNIMYLDSPNTTSSITYKTQFRSRDSGETVVVNWSAGNIHAISTITLMEIAA